MTYTWPTGKEKARTECIDTGPEIDYLLSLGDKLNIDY